MSATHRAAAHGTTAPGITAPDDAAPTAPAPVDTVHAEAPEPAASAAPRRRDPEARRRAILHAAAELIVEQGAAKLTHRAIAARAGVALGSTTQYFASIDDLREQALQQLSDEIDAELAAFAEQVDRHAEDIPRLIAGMMTEFTGDARQVGADIALMNAGVADADLRGLARRWFERVVDMLAPRIGAARATAIAVYLDGATMHAGLHDEPLSTDAMLHAVTALMQMETPGAEARA